MHARSVGRGRQAGGEGFRPMLRLDAARFVAVGLLAFSGCASEIRTLCGASTCQGCCDSTGRCQSGSADTACGNKGGVCSDCVPSGGFCLAGACHSRAAGDGGGTSGDGGRQPDGGTCQGRCSGPKVECSGSNAYRICVFFGGSCWDWVEGVCPPGNICSGGVCSSPDGGALDGGVASDGGCANRCSYLGQRQCAGTTAYVLCQPAAGCLAWGAPTACPNGSTCQGAGICMPACVSNCATKYTSRCNSAVSEVDICLPSNDGGCLQWRTFGCGDGYECSSGTCQYAATIPMGAPCASDKDCAAPSDGGYVFCIPEFPRGYCSQICDDNPNVYVASFWPCQSGRCEYAGTDPRGNPVAVCMATCPSVYGGQSTCRSEYVCDYSTQDIDGGVCWPNCTWYDRADAGGSGSYCGTNPDGGTRCTVSGYCQ